MKRPVLNEANIPGETHDASLPAFPLGLTSYSGLLDGFGNSYPEIQHALKAASAELYDIATRKR